MNMLIDVHHQAIPDFYAAAMLLERFTATYLICNDYGL
jgi:hypothetical protein